MLLRVVLALLAGLPLVASTPTGRIGTFDRTRLLNAWYSSPAWNQVLKAKTAERDAARATGDRRHVKSIEHWARNQQKLAQRQLAGKAKIDNILTTLQPAFAQLVRQGRVAAIVEHAPAGVATVDITPQLLDYLRPAPLRAPSRPPPPSARNIPNR